MKEEVIITSDMRTRIIDKIARVLSINHQHPEKRQYIESKDRLNFACPYCGDSSDNPRKKRGNVYWNDLYYHCYNCGHHTPLNIFLEDYNQSLASQDKIDVINYINENRKDFSLGESLDFYLFDTVKDLALTFDELALGFNVYPINELTYRAYPYLKSRLLHHNSDRFGYDPRRKELYIFNLTNERKIIGFQIRQLENNYGPKYKTWNIERIYDRLKLKLDINDDELDSINKISMLFGILQIDMSRTFTVFEGPIDAMFMKNSIGLTGVKKQIIEFNDIPTVRYFFDNDLEGKTKMIEKLKCNQSVFLWDKFIKDYHINSKKVKDLNDLIKYEYKYKTGCLKTLDKYFSNNPLDMIFI